VTRRKPCPNCPFRKDAKLAYWHPTMYLMLRDIEVAEGDFFSARSFGCHQDRHKPKKEVEPCVGWLLNQREHRVPNIALRLTLMTKPEVLAQFEESEADGELYETVDELVQTNLDQDRLLFPERYNAEGEYIGDSDDANLQDR